MNILQKAAIQSKKKCHKDKSFHVKENFFRQQSFVRGKRLKLFKNASKCCENLRRNWEIIFRVDY